MQRVRGHLKGARHLQEFGSVKLGKADVHEIAVRAHATMRGGDVGRLGPALANGVQSLLGNIALGGVHGQRVVGRVGDGNELVADGVEIGLGEVARDPAVEVGDRVVRHGGGEPMHVEGAPLGGGLGADQVLAFVGTAHGACGEVSRVSLGADGNE